MNIMDNIIIQHSICYDFLVSQVRMIHNKDFSPEDNPNQDIFSFFEKAKDKITPEMKERYKTYCNLETGFCMAMVGYIKKYDISNVPQFIEILQDIRPQEILTKFLYMGIGPGKDITPEDLNGLINNNQKSIDFINQNITHSPEEKWKILQFITDPFKMKSDLIELFKWHYENIFAAQETGLEKSLKKYEKELKNRLKKYGEEYFKLMVPFDYSKIKEMDEITLAISYYYERATMYDPLDDIYLFGYRYPEKIEGGHSILAGTQIFKALADETRLNIIRALAERPWYGHELAQLLNLSNSTVSHHVTNLVLNGLINSYREDNRVYFELDIEKLKKAVVETIDKIVQQ